MAIKFDFNKMRTAVAGWLTATDSVGTSLTAGEEAIYVPKMRIAKRVIPWSAATTLYASDSGAVVVTGDTAAGILTLPDAGTAGAGWYIDIFLAHSQASAATHISASGNGYFIGGTLISEQDTGTENLFFDLSDGNSNDWINLDDVTKGNIQGGHIQIICDGTNWLVSGVLNGSGTLAGGFADAES
jgi:hypothetical protein